MQAEQVFLVHRHLHLHDCGVDHFHEGHAGAHLVAFLHLAHVALLPDGVEHHDAVNGRMNLHQRGVGLGVQHGFAGAVALDFENANGSLCRLALQVEGLLQLCQRGLRLIEIFLGLFGVDAGEQLQLLHLQLRFR